MAETSEFAAVPAETPLAEAAAPRPEPAAASLDGAEEAAVNNAVINAENTNETSWVGSERPAVLGSYATPAPSASAETPAAPAEAERAAADWLPEQPSPAPAPAVFVAGYGSTPADLIPDQPAPEAAPAVFVAGYGSAPADLLPEQPAPEAAPAVFVAGYGSAAPSPAAEESPASPEQGSEDAPAWSATPTASESTKTVRPWESANTNRPWESANTNRDWDASVSSEAPPSEPTAAVDAVAAEPLASGVAPAPAALAEAPQESEPPGIATSIVVPPLPPGEAGEGGEWELLRNKVSTWFDGADLQGRWESLGGPLRAAGLLLAAVVLLRLYSALLDTLGDLPLVPRLLQLVGLVSVVQFGLTRLVRSSERERIVTSWRHRWNDFRGRD